MTYTTFKYFFFFFSYFACSSFITHGCIFKALHNCILLFVWRQDHCLSLILPLVAAGLSSCFFFSFGSEIPIKFQFLRHFYFWFLPCLSLIVTQLHLTCFGEGCMRYVCGHALRAVVFACDWPAWLKMNCKYRNIFENWIYWCSFSSVLSVVIETTHWCFS